MAVSHIVMCPEGRKQYCSGDSRVLFHIKATFAWGGNPGTGRLYFCAVCGTKEHLLDSNISASVLRKTGKDHTKKRDFARPGLTVPNMLLSTSRYDGLYKQLSALYSA